MAEFYTTLVIDDTAASGGGMPQLNAASYEEQLVWLVITFVTLYLFVARVALPRIGALLTQREETITNDLDTAEHRKRESDALKESYEAALQAARKQAHDLGVKNKEALMVKEAEVRHKLDAELGAKADEAEAVIEKAVADAMAGLDVLASDVAKDLVAKLSGKKAEDKAVSKAVKSSLSSMTGGA